MKSRTYRRDGNLLRVCIDCTQEMPLTSEFFPPRKSNEYGFNVRCHSCNKKYGRAYKERKMNTDADGKTLITNSCGHQFRYRIKRQGAVKWLEGQPCPSCKRQGIPPKPKDAPAPTPTPEPKPEPTPAPPEPEPEPKIEPDEGWVEGIMKMIPEGRLFHAVLPELILLLRAGIPVWLQGPPGTSKSTLAAQAAEGLDLSFHPVSCHELMTRSDLFGYTDAVGVDHRTPLWDAYEYGGLCLLDEVDNGNPNLLAALNSALSNEHCVFGSGTTVERHEMFRVVATANTAGLGPEHGFIGRNGVDLATRDRFVTMMVPIDDDLEEALAKVHLGVSTIEDLATRFRKLAKDALLERSTVRETPDARKLTATVRRLRQLVDTRFRGSVVSPRMTIHAAAMIQAGFTTREALESKLPGLKPDEVADLLKTALA